MGKLGLLRIGVKYFAMRIGRSTVATLGIVLAISFVIGGSLAVDSTVRDTLESTLDEACVFSRMCGEFYGLRYADSFNDSIYIANDLGNVSQVKQAEPLHHLQIHEVKSWSKDVVVHLSLRGTRSTYFSTMKTTPIFGDVSLERGDIVLPTVVADFLEVEIGGIVYYQNLYRNETTEEWEYAKMNFTLRGTFGEAGRYPVYRPDLGGGRYTTDYPFAYALVNIRDADWILERMKADELWLYQHIYEIHIEREEVIDPYNLEASEQNLQRLKSRLNNVAYVYEMQIEDIIDHPLREYYDTVLKQRGVFLALSIPILLLGLYVGFVGFSLQEKTRRKEISTMIARGADRKHISAIFLSQGLLQGALAGIFGLLLGLLLSRVIILGVFQGSSSVASLQIAPLSVFLSILFGIVLVLVAIYASVRGIWKEQASPSMKDISRTLRESEYKPNLDFALLGLSVIIIVISIPGLLGSSFTFFLGDLVYFLAPISPFLLVFSVARLSTRYSEGPLRTTSKATRPFTRRLWRFVDRNLARERKRSSSLCVFITLCIFFGVMATMLVGIQYGYDERVARATTGGDILLGSRIWYENLTKNVSNIEGVRAATAVVPLSCDRTGVTAIDPQSYMNATYLEDYYFVEGSPSENILKLQQNGNALISVEESDRLGVDVGDNLIVGVSSVLPDENVSSHKYYTFRIVGLIRHLPLRELFDEEHYVTSVVIGFNSLEPERREYEIAESYYYYYIIKVEKGYKDSEVAKDIVGMGIDIREMIIYSEILSERREDPLSAGVVNFLSIQAMFASVLVAVGLDVVLFSSYLERKEEFATMGARGLKRSQLAAILFGEGFAILLLALIIGIAGGIIGAISYDLFYAGSTNFILPRPIVFPLSSLLFVFLSLASILIAITVVVIWVSRMSLPSELRLRGG